MEIKGSTSVYWIAGEPVDQVRAPEVFNAVFSRLGIDAVLVPVAITKANFVEFALASLRVANFKGFWLAIPHKVTVMPMLTRCSSAGLAAGAVNAVKMQADGGLVGDAFDGVGFVGALKHLGIDYRGKRALIVGAGGGGAAIAVSLMDGGVDALALYDIDQVRAALLAQRVTQQCGRAPTVIVANTVSGFDLVIHATPLGLSAQDPIPFDVTQLSPGCAVVDILMKNQPTPLIRAVRAQGLRAEPGFEMLIQQIPSYLEFFGHDDAAQAVRENRFGLTDELRALMYPKGWPDTPIAAAELENDAAVLLDSMREPWVDTKSPQVA